MLACMWAGLPRSTAQNSTSDVAATFPPRREFFLSFMSAERPPAMKLAIRLWPQ